MTDEIEIRRPLLNCLNILEHIWWLLNSDLQFTDFKKWLTITFNNLSQNNVAPKRYSRKFSKLNWKKIALRHLLKSRKYWNSQVLLEIIETTITQLNFLFVLYYWSSYCRHLMKLLMKWVQCINKYQKPALGGPMMKQFVLPRHTHIITEKGFNLFDECAARCVHLLLQEEEYISSSCGNSKMYTSSRIAKSQRMQTEIKKSGTIAKIRT